MGGNLALLVKPVSGLCNMRCSYCFYRDLVEEAGEGGRGIMDGRTTRALCRRIFENRPDNVSLAFQGGEPTLWGAERFGRFLDCMEEENKQGVPVHYAVQTNALELDAGMVELWKKHGFLVGASLDGRRSLHDRYRRLGTGEGTFKDVLKNISMLLENGIKVNILCVVTGDAAESAEQIYNFFVGRGYTHIQFIPCLDTHKKAGRGYSLTPGGYGRFLCGLYDLWERGIYDGRYTSVRQFDNYIYMLKGLEPENCSMAGACSENYVVEADGSVYPCDFYATKSHLLGNINKMGFLQMDMAASFFRREPRHMEACGECEYYSICRGGCKRDLVRVDEGKNMNRLCGAYKIFFRHSLERMRRLAEAVD